MSVGELCKNCKFLFIAVATDYVSLTKNFTHKILYKILYFFQFGSSTFYLIVIFSTAAVVKPSRVDLHTPKMLIIQFHTSSVWKNACHTIFIQFLKMVEKRYKLISVAV